MINFKIKLNEKYMQYGFDDVTNFYKYILSKDCKTSRSFFDEFNENWNELLVGNEDILLLNNGGLQLRNGGRLRPRLVALGLLLGNNDDNQIIDTDLLFLSSMYIELVHKTSILLDDYYDDDKSRHGQEAFHIEFGSNKTIVTSHNLMMLHSKIFLEIYERLNNVEDSIIFNIQNIGTVMNVGLSKELNLNIIEDSFFNICEIIEIIEMQTVHIIKESLLLGYLISGNYDKSIYDLLSEIGGTVAYCFQVLNDLEPFTEGNGYIEHKGKNNFDILKSRKNYTIAFLGLKLDEIEKRDLILKVKNNINKDILFNDIKVLLIKYEVVDLILSEIEQKMKNTINTINYNNNISGIKKELLTNFLEYTYKKCLDRL